MVSLLPNHVQERVMSMLNSGDFAGAKAIYDQWQQNHNQSPWEMHSNDDEQENSFIQYPIQ